MWVFKAYEPHVWIFCKEYNAVKFVTGNRVSNIGLLCMIKVKGAAIYEIHTGAINSEILTQFLENNQKVNNNNSRTTVVIDNVRFHHSQIVKNIYNRKNVPIRYLPAYSPQLNPIEEFFSVVKARYNDQRSPKRTFEEI